MVFETSEYSLDYENLDKCWDILKNCNVVFVDDDYKTYMVIDDSKKPIGEAPLSIKPGNYIPSKEALYGLDRIITESKSDNGENNGGTPYVKTKQS